MARQPAFLKHQHKAGCEGGLYRLDQIVHIDEIGRLDNGGIVAHDYRCNMRWEGCGARVLVTEAAVHAIATSTLDAG
jgi:hypothetical protein